MNQKKQFTQDDQVTCQAETSDVRVSLALCQSSSSDYNPSMKYNGPLLTIEPTGDVIVADEMLTDHLQCYSVCHKRKGSKSLFVQEEYLGKVPYDGTRDQIIAVVEYNSALMETFDQFETLGKFMRYQRLATDMLPILTIVTDLDCRHITDHARILELLAPRTIVFIFSGWLSSDMKQKMHDTAMYLSRRKGKYTVITRKGLEPQMCVLSRTSE